jgi:coiled-coil domain-containing protein 61
MAATATSNGKRFLILTYAVEFDRVHYPLPLTLELSPSPEVLQRTIRRLRQAVAEKENSSGGEGRLADENAALREENRCLKNTLQQYVREDSQASSTGDLQQELHVSGRNWVGDVRSV